ncbi:cupin domain-containing protein [Rhizobium cauense]|uniref:cupin domain-containing protein n=1 Tax=Rhizobium cauense TaxID=1166683 RepID=UPI001C6E0B93|nr:cupin domain-containing protein [Rhizobium cauense]MBW9116060.1 cupin domain-containing protein [Rhizobium cauense]
MNILSIASAAVTFSLVAIHGASAQQPGIKRTDLVKNDIVVSGKEAIQVRVDFDPGAFAVNHRHPGEEIAYVLEGALEYKLEGRGAIILTAGQSLFIPYGVAHSARNVGSGNASELATYIVTKGSPLVEPVQ